LGNPESILNSLVEILKILGLLSFYLLGFSGDSQLSMIYLPAVICAYIDPEALKLLKHIELSFETILGLLFWLMIFLVPIAWFIVGYFCFPFPIIVAVLIAVLVSFHRP